MKTPRFILAGSLLATLLFNLLPLQLIAASDKEQVLVDLTDVEVDRVTGSVTKNYEYTFGDWEKHVTDAPRHGSLIRAKTGKGGMGENGTKVKFFKTPKVSLVLALGNGNNAKSINFVLEDLDGTEQSWSIPFEGLNKGSEYRVLLDLSKCTTESKPGKKPGLDLKKINTWQVRGDYSDLNIEVLLIKLVADKE